MNDPLAADPQATPGQERKRSALRGPAAVVPFDLGSLLRSSWSVFQDRMVANLAVVWTALALAIACRWIQAAALQRLVSGQSGRLEAALLRFGAVLALGLPVAWLAIGLCLALLAICRGEPAILPRLFRGGRYVLPTLLAGLTAALILALIVFAILACIPMLGALPVPRVELRQALTAVTCAAAAVAALHVGVRLSPFPFVIVDQRAGALESLQRSWQATRGQAGTLTLVYVATLLINLAGLLVLLLGLLITLPYTCQVLVTAYLSLTGQPVSRAGLETCRADLKEQ